jgi:SAM-dependent methyltransferase
MPTIQDRYPHLLTTDGWLYDETAQATEDLLTYQRSRGLTGDILEIGVYLGRYFILLAKQLMPEETIIGVDIFHSAEPRIPGSANIDRDACIINLKRYLPELWPSDRLVILEEDSRDLATSDYAATVHGTFRFISIDGSHDEVTVYSDLRLAHDLLLKGGLVALDDWNDEQPPQWPGVKLGWAMYDEWATQRQREPRLRIVGEVPNKLILCNDGVWAGDYRLLLKDRGHGVVG